mgnify:CR=1 FL=1
MNKKDFARLDFPPYKYHHLALKYCKAGMILLDSHEMGPADQPLYYLFCHAIELSLKGFLRIKAGGYSSKCLKNTGHDIAYLHVICAKKGLSLDGRNYRYDRRLIRNLNRYYLGKEFEYMQLGGLLLPEIATVAEFAEVLVKSCYTISE